VTTNANLLVMTILLGADIQEIHEVRTSIELFGDRYVRRIYTEYEIGDCMRLGGSAAGILASRFAAKEAMFKVLTKGNPWASWKEVEVGRLKSGQPTIILSGAAAC
jgi:holo-[acyl-carrier protein] synthase